MLKPLLEMKDITKRFPGVMANNRVNFSLLPGEIHALLGENGSGKTTLMSILSGIYRPDEGDIFINGSKVHFRSPKDAILSNIGMVHQHFKLIETFTVAENIVLGTKSAFWHKKQLIEKNIMDVSMLYGIKINPGARIWQLSVGEKQRVEILKMLYRGSQVLVLDEPTSVLTPQEAKELFNNLKAMTATGKSVILITHKLNEVMAIADRVTVLRAGQAVATLQKEDLSAKKLARLMVGSDINIPQKTKDSPGDETVLTLDNVFCTNDAGLTALKNFSLTLKKGEILGIAGVAGNGQRELSEIITGMRKVDSGIIILKGNNVTDFDARQMIDCGVSHIPEDRLETGLIPGIDIVDNFILKEYRNSKFTKGPFIDFSKASIRAQNLVQEYNIQVASLKIPVRQLSGGNLQKLLLAREISTNPVLIVAVYPVRGLDVGATCFVHELLLEQRAKGVSIILVSEDLEELFKLSDRIAVLYEGQIQAIVQPAQTNLEEIGLLMTGSRKVAV